MFTAIFYFACFHLCTFVDRIKILTGGKTNSAFTLQAEKQESCKLPHRHSYLEAFLSGGNYCGDHVEIAISYINWHCIVLISLQADNNVQSL